eukprot:UN03666
MEDDTEELLLDAKKNKTISGTKRNGDISLWYHILVIVLSSCYNRVTHSYICHLMFNRGCTSSLFGGWKNCNIHIPNELHCPWCVIFEYPWYPVIYDTSFDQGNIRWNSNCLYVLDDIYKCLTLNSDDKNSSVQSSISKVINTVGKLFEIFLWGVIAHFLACIIVGFIYWIGTT